jgi:translation initiation factor IF-3
MKRFQAEQLARDKALKLVLVIPASESQPIPQYRLMTNSEYRAEAKLVKQAKRLDKSPETKTLKLNVSIAEHDMNIKISHVTEWLQSGHDVKVIMLSSRSKNSSVS